MNLFEDLGKSHTFAKKDKLNFTGVEQKIGYKRKNNELPKTSLIPGKSAVAVKKLRKVKKLIKNNK